VFAWALLDGLRNRDTNGNGIIQLSELVAQVQKTVPGVAAKLGELGRTVTRSEPAFGVQTPRFGSARGDFALVKRLP
jgi:hypothetical protein